MTKANNGAMSHVKKNETTLWEERWVQCAKQLNQWEMLSDYARSVDHFELMLEYAALYRLYLGVADGMSTGMGMPSATPR